MISADLLSLMQVEEVQKMKRKRKAESLRALNMAKRQKQRLEEIRESQKKVEMLNFYAIRRLQYYLTFLFSLSDICIKISILLVL